MDLRTDGELAATLDPAPARAADQSISPGQLGLNLFSGQSGSAPGVRVGGIAGALPKELGGPHRRRTAFPFRKLYSPSQPVLRIVYFSCPLHGDGFRILKDGYRSFSTIVSRP